MAESRESSVPGIHRWLVLLSCFMTITLNLGFILSFGNLFKDIMDTFNVSRTEASLVQSTMMAVAFGMGIFNGFIVEKLGPMWAGLIAASLSSIGLIVSFFATSVTYLVLSVGIVSGPGLLCLFICSSVITKRYFPGKLGPIAMSLSHLGSVAGGMSFPFLMRYLTDHYGLRGTLLILGGVLLNTIPFCLFWRSPVIKPTPNNPTQTDNVITNVANSENKIDAQSDHNQFDSRRVHDAVYDNEAFTPSTQRKQFEKDNGCKMQREHNENNFAGINNCVSKSVIMSRGVKDYTSNTDTGLDQTEHSRVKRKQSTTNNDNQIEKCYTEDNTIGTAGLTRRKSVSENVLLAIQHTADTTIWTRSETRKKSVFQNVLRAIQNIPHFLYAIGMTLAYQLIHVVMTFIVDIFTDADLTASDAALGLLIAQLASAIGRLLPGFMIHLKFITTITIPIVACVGTSIAALAVLLFKSLAMKLLFLGLFGVFYGMFVVSYALVAMRICEAEYMSNGIGLTFTLSGIAIAAFGPLTGWIRDETGTYLVPFLMCIGINVVALTLFITAQILRNRQKKRLPPEVEMDTYTDYVTHL